MCTTSTGASAPHSSGLRDAAVGGKGRSLQSRRPEADLRGRATERGRDERRLPAETGVKKMATTKRVLYVGEQARVLD
ncbi:hypothetical protein U0070_001524 [Myodes glareolus]|uniref:Uncharacterized protein n=1 Tax=Myodes glareolus TaxID=447135 RepID=A0AAW0IDF0_MYOGA